MNDFGTILPVAQTLCDSGAEALQRYYTLTDLDPAGVPESFIASFVFDRLGNQISMAPEVTISTLWRWNEDAHGRPTLQLPDELEDRQRRIDLVLFRKTSRIKSDDVLWALIEFKRNWKVQGDIVKLKSVLPLVDKCEFGISCGVVEPLSYPGWLDSEGARMRARGEEFVVSRPCDLIVHDKQRSFAVFAHVFSARP